ncbi:MAG: ABC transporter ATP-binding protein [Clostridiales bacterium]|nr:ABC transporter ATP-binding protein [Clostridiales bacterium]
MLEIKNLTKTYAGGAVKAVDDLSLTVSPGEIFGFLGPNGAGKSTTIKSMIGILPFETGNVKIFGFDLKKESIEAKKIIGFVPDNNVVYDKLTGIEYLNFMSTVYGVDDGARKKRIEKYGALFNLSDDLGKQIKKYSHGMRQKICIMGAIIHEPKLWVLDEPMTGLDPQSVFDLKKLMREYCVNGKIVFFSSHVLDVAEKLCDRIAIINKGRLAVNTTMAELKEKQSDRSLEEYFLSVTGDGR